MQLAFVTTTSDSYRQIKLWTDYHKSIGVGSFYLFVDGQVLLQHPALCPMAYPPLQCTYVPVPAAFAWRC